MSQPDPTEQDNTVPQVVGTILVGSLFPGLYIEGKDGSVAMVKGLLAMDDGTVRWRQP